jgi:hypothetical protein
MSFFPVIAFTSIRFIYLFAGPFFWASLLPTLGLSGFLMSFFPVIAFTSVRFIYQHLSFCWPFFLGIALAAVRLIWLFDVLFSGHRIYLR